MQKADEVRALLAEMRAKLEQRTEENARRIDPEIYCLSHMIAIASRECALPELDLWRQGRG